MLFCVELETVSVQTAHVADRCSIKASPDLAFHILCELEAEDAKLRFEYVSEKLGNIRVLPLTSSRSYRPRSHGNLVSNSLILGKVSRDQT